MLYVILWLACSLIAASIYNQKRRPWYVGALAGLLLGPVGIVLAAFSSAIPVEAPAGKKCRWCAMKIPFEARVCPHCQRDQFPPVPS